MAGLKRSQAAWSNPKKLDALHGLSREDKESLRAVFAEQFSLDHEEGIRRAKEVSWMSLHVLGSH